MIDIAIEAAKAGARIGNIHFKNIPTVSYKTDKSPVTKADIEAEKAIRKVITKNFPEHEIVGEETGVSGTKKSKYQWVIDPIDGTRSYIRGIPQWCVLISVLENNKPIIGVCYYPNQDELFSAQKGKGTYLNNKKTSISKINKLGDAYISYYNLKHFDRLNKIKNLIELCKKTNTSSNYASFSMSYFLKGKIEAYICAHGQIWDYAAFAILTEEAGGIFSDFSGKKSLTSEKAIFTNKALHKQVLNILNK